MAQVLTTKGSAAALEELIRKAEKEIFLISFSYIISDMFITRLKKASDRGVKIHLVYGKSIRYDTLEHLKGIRNISIYHYRNLHAKLFANETRCIIGSMNFSEVSEFNNTELGVLLTAEHDKAAFEEAMVHCSDIVAEATQETVNFPEQSTPEKVEDKAQDDHTSKPLTHVGYCIRTGNKIPVNHAKPFCLEAYTAWAEWANDDYPEKYCHFSGEISHGQTSKAHPILGKHWKEYQAFIGAVQ